MVDPVAFLEVPAVDPVVVPADLVVVLVDLVVDPAVLPCLLLTITLPQP